MSIDTEQERAFSLIEQLYRPFANIVELEANKAVLPLFSSLQEGGIVIGSGSPRNPRFMSELAGLQVSQLPISHGLHKLKEQGAQFLDLINILESYREPRRSWDLSGDNGLSVGKARLSIAAALALQFARGIPFPKLFITIGRDYTLANHFGQFLERPGFTFRYQVEGVDMPESWVVEGEDPDPDLPAEQLKILSLLDSPQPFYVANSTALLQFEMSQAFTMQDIRQIYDLREPIPAFIKSRVITTYMALMPDEAIMDGREGVVPMNLFDYFTKCRMPYGDKLYSIPGVIDWSRPPFRDHLLIFSGTGNQSLISSDLPALMDDIANRRGEWSLFNQASLLNPNVDNELVGVSTFATHKMIR